MLAANRMNQIQENINVDHWSYVSSKENPADDASCGLDLRRSDNG